MAFLQKYASYKLFVILNSTIPKTWNLIAKKMKENILNFYHSRVATLPGKT